MTLMPQLIREEKTGLYLRPGRGEEGVIKEQHATYKTLEIEDKVCLDLGGHVGCFVNYALNQRGARQIISVEPEPESFSILQLNSKGTNTILYNAAVVTEGSEEEIDFFLYKTFSAMNSIYHKRGRQGIRVKTIPFTELLDKHKPDTVKMDIEGSEHKLSRELGNLPDFVTSIAIELHFLNVPSYFESANTIIKKLEEQGFTATKEPRIAKTHWAHHFAAMGVWHR